MENRTAVNPGKSFTLTTSGTSARSGALAQSTGLIRLVATADMFVTFGGPAVVAVAATETPAEHCCFLPAGIPEYFAFDPGENYIAAIQSSAAGTLYVTEMV